jgi:hypothetical protein
MALNLLARIQRFMDRQKARRGMIPDHESPTFDWDWDERRDLYTRWESLYANSVYLDQQYGGFREIILSENLGVEDTDKRLDGYYNPIGCIVDAYQNVLRGHFGKEILISDIVTRTTQQADPVKVNQRILDPISRIYRWSNLNERKESLQYWCALHGAVGLRIEAPTSGRDGRELAPAQRKVRIRPIHPREIVDFNEDGEGNIEDVLLEYSVLEGGLGEDRDDDTTTYREILSRDRLIKKREEQTIFDEPNALGLCPFVLLRQKDVGSQFGCPAHYGTEQQLHLINWLLTRTSISVDRHVFAKWLAAASGAKPETFDMGDTSVAYVQMAPGDTRPMLEAVVAKLDFIGIERLLLFFIAHLRQRQPELVLSALEAMSGQSGETIAKLLIPIEERILAARTHYERAIVKATQHALSWGIVNGIWDIGTGTGSKEAADDAYEKGLEEFQFNERGALPETVFDRINRAKADNAPALERANVAKAAADIVSVKEQLRMMGYTEQSITKIMKEKATQDVNEDDDELVGGGGNGSAPAQRPQPAAERR